MEKSIINPTIFKSYDIRGIYPDELNEEAVYKIGQSFAVYTAAKNVVVGRDMRVSSDAIFKALTEGIISQGADVYNLGRIPTEVLYFAVGNYGYEAGITITASHNPKEYNGFKMIKKGVEVIRGVEIGSFIEKGDFPPSSKKGEIKEVDIWENYLSHIFSFVRTGAIKPFKIVVDASNGMAGKVVPFISARLPIKIVPLNFELDGNFPNHPPNPLLEGATNQIKATIIKEQADFGFIFDGDADRVFLLDENGNLVRADVILLLLAKYFLAKNPGAGIAYNLICSKATPEFIKKWGGRPIKTKVGFVNVKEGIMKNDGIMGGELSGHYSFKDNFYSDSGFITFLILLQIISKTNKKVSELASELSPYSKESEINFKIQDKEAVLNRIKEKYSDGKQGYLDGVTIEYKDWWFNIRSSQTEPLLRLTIEAANQKLLQEKKKELLALLTEK